MTLLSRPFVFVISAPRWLFTLPRLLRRLLVVLSLVMLLVFAACRGIDPHTSKLTGVLPIGAPAVASTGQQIDVEIGPVVTSNGTPVGLIMVGAHGPRVYNTTFEAGMAHFVIPSKDTLQPGYLALIVAAEDARGEASILLHAGGQRAVFPLVGTTLAPVPAT